MMRNLEQEMLNPNEQQDDGGQMSERVDALMKGSIDLHVHSGPSVMARKLDHIDEIKEAAAAGQRAILIKDHYYPGAPIVNLLKPHMEEYGVELLGGIPLNNTSGGLNPFTVDTFLKMGASLVWMPTSSAANHIRSTHRKKRLVTAKPMRPAEGISVVDNKGNLVDEVKEILDLIAEFDAVLSSGHLHISEIWPLFEEAKARGVNRRLVNHPTYVVGCSLADITELTEGGAVVEHSAAFYIESKFTCYTPEELRQHIDAGGVDRTVLGSDLGQSGNPSPVEGMRTLIEMCLNLGYSDEDIRKMTTTNCARIIGFEGANFDGSN
ncbi:DUF6282 family protein [Hoeflea sp. TYP-13]|uniref:DUF6282 family protein n=1 Tax=Hoeflea sp. TYP-13 TaxID=3230023 RepID=UPI0034C654AC